MSDEARDSKDQELLERYDHPDSRKLHEADKAAGEKVTEELERELTPYERNINILNKHHGRFLTEPIENEDAFREKVEEYRLAYLEEKLSGLDIPDDHKESFREIVRRRVSNNSSVKTMQGSFAQDVLSEFDSIHGKYEASMAEGGKADQTRKLYGQYPSMPRDALFSIDGVGFWDEPAEPEGLADLE